MLSKFCRTCKAKYAACAYLEQKYHQLIGIYHGILIALAMNLLDMFVNDGIYLITV